MRRKNCIYNGPCGHRDSVTCHAGSEPPSCWDHMCHLDEHYPFEESTQCKVCQMYGHHPRKCFANPVCAVCAEGHWTREHSCAMKSCKAGTTCTHPSIKCAACKQPHKASYINYPTHIKLERSRRGPEPASVQFGKWRNNRKWKRLWYSC